MENYKAFVLNYTVKDNQITISFANGKNDIIPYTARNEICLLEKMKTQASQSDELMRKQEKRFSKSWKDAIWSFILIACNLINLICGSSIPIISGICISVLGLCLISEIYRMSDSTYALKIINRMLLNTQKKINEKAKENQKVLANTDEKTKEMVHSTGEDQPVFTLNNIDNIEYEELEQIPENMDREEETVHDNSSKSDEKSLDFKKKIR